MNFIRRNILLFIVFITGAAVLVVEVVATRILAPYFGNTIYTVSSILGVVLAALSAGYYLGGRFSDKHPSLKWFFGIILASGLSIFLLELLILFVLPKIGYALSIVSGPLISAIILFFIPSFLLGTLSPFAIKLQEKFFPKEGIGSIAGKVFFWSTLGSISGSLLSGFVFIPRFGVRQIIIAMGIILTAISMIALFLLGFKKRDLSKIIFLAGIIIISVIVLSVPQMGKGVVYNHDGVYQKLIIRDVQYQNKPARFLWQDRNFSSGIFLDSKKLVFEYTKYYTLYKVFKPDIQEALFIGGGAYSMPEALLGELPDINIEVAEIEPFLFELAKKFFRVSDSSRLKNYIEDGRRFLYDSQRDYDLIYSDVYFSLYSIPAHFTTQEFFELGREKLSADGIFIANIIGSLDPKPPSLIFSEIKTFKSVFENSYFFAVDSPESLEVQNIIFVGYNSNRKIDFSNPVVGELVAPLIDNLGERLISLDQVDFSVYPILTDDYCPVDYLTVESLKKIK